MTIYQLILQKQLLGTLTLVRVDQPFFYCHFEPTGLFLEQYSALFQQLLDYSAQDQVDQQIALQDQLLDQGLHLKGVGTIIHDFSLLIDLKNKIAWYRY